MQKFDYFAGGTDGTTIIKAKKSRSHTELLCKYLVTN